MKAAGVALIVDEATYRGIIQRITAQGYDPNDLVRTVQDNR